jgi:uncharacterized membrane protein YdjX (TVP38/TMEM64 family)
MAALRLLLLAVVIVALLLLVRFSAVGTHLTAAGVRQAIQGAGAPGVAAFIGLFALGQLAHVPGILFFTASLFAYGRGWGFVVSYVAALVSVSISFAFVRAIGGQPLAVVEAAWLRRLLSNLDQRPFATVFVLRTILMAAPAVNYSLALSSLRFPLYFAGSAAGLVVPLVVLSAVYGVLFH